MGPSAALVAQQQQLMGRQMPPGAALPTNHHLPPRQPTASIPPQPHATTGAAAPTAASAQIPDVSAAVAAAIEASNQPAVPAQAQPEPLAAPGGAGALHQQQHEQTELPTTEASGAGGRSLGDVAMPQAPLEATAQQGAAEDAPFEPELSLALPPQQQQPAPQDGASLEAAQQQPVAHAAPSVEMGSAPGVQSQAQAHAPLAPSLPSSSGPPSTQASQQTPQGQTNKPPEGSLVATLMEEFDVDLADLLPDDLDPGPEIQPSAAPATATAASSPRASFRPADDPFAVIQDPLSSSASLRGSPRGSPPRPGSAAADSEAVRVASLSGWMHGSPGNVPSPRGTPAGPSNTVRTTAGTGEQHPAAAGTPASGSPPDPAPLEASQPAPQQQ